MNDTRWLTPDERAAWIRFLAVVQLLPGALDTQLGRDADLTNFEYMTLAMLSEVPERTLRMTALAQRTNATLPRLSRVVAGLERRGYVERETCAEDRRATNVSLTAEGWAKVVASAPGHVENVRRVIFDALTPEQVGQLAAISLSLLDKLDPEGWMLAHTESAPTGSGSSSNAPV